MAVRAPLVRRSEREDHWSIGRILGKLDQGRILDGRIGMEQFAHSGPVGPVASKSREIGRGASDTSGRQISQAGYLFEAARWLTLPEKILCQEIMSWQRARIAQLRREERPLGFFCIALDLCLDAADQERLRCERRFAGAIVDPPEGLR